MLSPLPKTNINFLDTSILSSANALNLDRSKILPFGKGLILYHTIQSLQEPEEDAFWNTVGEKEKILDTIFSFPRQWILSMKEMFRFWVICSKQLLQYCIVLRFPPPPPPQLRRLSRDICPETTCWAPVPFNFDLPKWNLQMAHLLIRENSCPTLFWNPSKNIAVMVLTNPEAWTFMHTHKHTHVNQSAIVATMCSSVQAGWTKNTKIYIMCSKYSSKFIEIYDWIQQLVGLDYGQNADDDEIKAICIYENLNLSQPEKKFFERIENITGSQYFLLFPQHYQ